MSKSLLSLYHNYLKVLRVKRFQRKIAYKKFFQKGWFSSFKRIQLLRRILSKIEERAQLNERLKYQREFETKREVIMTWKDRVDDKKQLIQYYTALTHYKHTLICKSFLAWKRDLRMTQGLTKLHNFILVSRLNPSFQSLKHSSHLQQQSEHDF